MRKWEMKEEKAEGSKLKGEREVTVHRLRQRYQIQG